MAALTSEEAARVSESAELSFGVEVNRCVANPMEYQRSSRNPHVEDVFLPQEGGLLLKCSQ